MADTKKYVDYNGLSHFKAKNDLIYAKSEDIPTNNNQLTNGAGYQTSTQVENAITSKNYTTMTAVENKGYQNASQVSTAINNALKDVTGIKYEIVQSLPTTGNAGTIYLVSHGGTGSNVYDEYIWVNNKFEKIGTTDVDLSNYYNTSNLLALENTEIDKIFE